MDFKPGEMINHTVNSRVASMLRRAEEEAKARGEIGFGVPQGYIIDARGWYRETARYQVRWEDGTTGWYSEGDIEFVDGW